MLPTRPGLREEELSVPEDESDLIPPERLTRRSKTVHPRNINRQELEYYRRVYTEDVFAERPKTRGECQGGVRPCPFVSCKYNLYLDVNEDRGSIIFNYPGKEPDELEQSCALDIADEGGSTLETVGDVLRVSRERVRQIEAKFLAKLKRHPRLRSIHSDGSAFAHPAERTFDE